MSAPFVIWYGFPAYPVTNSSDPAPAMAALEPAGELARLMRGDRASLLQRGRVRCAVDEGVAGGKRAGVSRVLEVSLLGRAAPEIDRERRRAEQDDEGERDDDEDLARLAACHQLITIVTVARRLIMPLEVARNDPTSGTMIGCRKVSVTLSWQPVAR